MGLAGVVLSAASFGLSRSLMAMLISRSIAGALSGNVAVISSMLGEITDETNEGMGALSDRALLFFFFLLTCVGILSVPLGGRDLESGLRPVCTFTCFSASRLLTFLPYFSGPMLGGFLIHPAQKWHAFGDSWLFQSYASYLVQS